MPCVGETVVLHIEKFVKLSVKVLPSASVWFPRMGKPKVAYLDFLCLVGSFFSVKKLVENISICLLITSESPGHPYLRKKTA